MRDKNVLSELKHKVPINENNFRKIISFYLLESPVDETSYRGNTFYEKGWRGAKFATLKKKLLKTSETSLVDNYYPSKKDELSSNFKKCEKLSSEYCVFLKHEERAVIPSLFSAIRNSFAHGSFDVRNYKGQKVYFFANYDKYLKAKIVLHEKTLLNWIKEFNSI